MTTLTKGTVRGKQRKKKKGIRKGSSYGTAHKEEFAVPWKGERKGGKGENG